MRILKQGNIGIDVFMLQFELDIFATGYFDQRTTNAVKAYQKANKLEADGEVGLVTHNKLYSKKTSEPAKLNLKEPSQLAALHPNKPWLNRAFAEEGEREWPGRLTNSARIKQYHQSTSNKRTDDESPWCSSFMNFVMTEDGYIGTNDPMAMSWLKWTGGDVVSIPEPGDIVITREKAAADEEKANPKDKTLVSKGYHVAFYLGSYPKGIIIFGGNQGKDGEGRVSRAHFQNEKYTFAYRRPKPKGGHVVLKLGNILCGGCTLKEHKGSLPVATLTTGFERATSMVTGEAPRWPGMPSFESISLARVSDGSIGALHDLALRGTSGLETQISFLRGGLHEYLVLKLRDVILSGYSMKTRADGTSVEGITLSYSWIEITRTDYDASGKARGVTRVAYDLKIGKLA